MADGKQRGFFFVVEGIDGCGKTTQTTMLTEFLKRQGRQVQQVQDPGTTQAGLKLRELLLNKEIAMSVANQTLCFTAARAELAAVIREYLELGVDVVGDRWFLSTLAYQGVMHGRTYRDDLRPLVDLHAQYVGLYPDVCVLLDVDAAETNARMLAAGRDMDRFESKPLEWRTRLSGAYLQAADAYGRVSIINGMRPVEVVHADVMCAIAKTSHEFANLLARQKIFDTLRTAK